MIPARFDYEVAESTEHALELLGSREDAKLLAGGHSLIPAMKLRIARPELLVDIGRVSSLAYVRDAGESLAIGALTRHRTLATDPLVQEHCPIVSHTAGLIGDPQVRHRGTIGGSLAHGDPASDLPAVMLALEAELVIVGPDGRADGARGRVLPRRLRHGCRTGGAADRDPGAEARRRRAGRTSSSTGVRRTGRPSAWPRSCGVTTAASARPGSR